MPAPKTSIVYTAVIRGCDVVPIKIETTITHGMLPGLDLVGFRDSEASEIRSHVRCAMKASGLEMPRARVTVSVADGITYRLESAFETQLAIVVGILAAEGALSPEFDLERCAFVGRLDPVTGDVLLPEYGQLALEHELAKRGLAFTGAGPVMLPECSHVVANVADLVVTVPDIDDIMGRITDALRSGDRTPIVIELNGRSSDAAESLARDIAAFRFALGNLSESDALEVRMMHSIAPCTYERCTVTDEHDRKPPVVIAQGMWSSAAFVGGGHPVKPGCVSQADHGVLVIANAQDMSENTLRLVLEATSSGSTSIIRVSGVYTMPARTLTVLIIAKDDAEPEQTQRLFAKLDEIGATRVAI